MSTAEVTVLNAKLDMVIETINEIKADNKKINGRLTSVEGKVALLNSEHCRIQEQKKDAKRPWYSVVPTIVSSLAVLVLAIVLALK